MSSFEHLSIKQASEWFLKYYHDTHHFSEQTIITYKQVLDEFIEFLNTYKKMKNVTIEDIYSFREFILLYKSNNVNTINKYSSVLRSIFKFFNHNGANFLAHERIDLGKSKESCREGFSQDEIKKITNTKEKESFIELRNKAIILILYSTGIRVSELCGITISDIFLAQKEISVLGKGNKRRVVFLSLEAIIVLKKYIKARGTDYGFLFYPYDHYVDYRDKPLTRQVIYRIVNTSAINSDIIKKVSPHMFRHTFATTMLQHGADIRSVQMMLGHASIVTTQIYTHMTDPQLKKVHETYFEEPEED